MVYLLLYVDRLWTEWRKVKEEREVNLFHQPMANSRIFWSIQYMTIFKWTPWQTVPCRNKKVFNNQLSIDIIINSDKVNKVTFTLLLCGLSTLTQVDKYYQLVLMDALCDQICKHPLQLSWWRLYLDFEACSVLDSPPHRGWFFE